MRSLYAAVTLAVLACGSEPPKSDSATPEGPVTTCGVTPATVLTGVGLGELRVGVSVERLRAAACDVVSDSTIALGNEGMPERRIAVALATDTIATLVESNTVRRLEVTTARFRTADSLGVGSTAGTLRAMNATLAVGDRGVFALVAAHCGLSFHLAGVSPAQGSWSDIPDSTPVDRVLVYGC